MQRTDTSSSIYLASSADSSNPSSFTYSIKINLFVMTFSWHLQPRRKTLHPLGSGSLGYQYQLSRQQTRSCFSEVRKVRHRTQPALIHIPIALPFPKGLRKKNYPPPKKKTHTKPNQTQGKKKKKKANAELPASTGINTFVIQINWFFNP